MTTNTNTPVWDSLNGTRFMTNWRTSYNKTLSRAKTSLTSLERQARVALSHYEDDPESEEVTPS